MLRPLCDRLAAWVVPSKLCLGYLELIDDINQQAMPYWIKK